MNAILLYIIELARGQADMPDMLGWADLERIISYITENTATLQEGISALAAQNGPVAEAHVVLLAAGVVIFLGVMGEAFFKRTGIPDVAFLMILGVVIGPVLGIVQHEMVVREDSAILCPIRR